MNFGDTCLYLAKDKDVNWETARVYCQGLGGDLAVFRDANAYADALGYVKASGWFCLALFTLFYLFPGPSELKNAEWRNKTQP